jgi:hypothetical protein
MGTSRHGQLQPVWCARGAGSRRGGSSGGRGTRSLNPSGRSPSRPARADGVSRTAAVLHLDYCRLKDRAAAAPASRPQPSGPAFVELSPPAPVTRQCQFEFDNGAGATMRVHLVGYDAADVEALSRSFWNAL